MRWTSIGIYGGLLIAALIASYLTWTHEPPGGKGDVVVFDTGAGGLQAVVYEEPDLRVQVELREGGDDGVCWGTTRRVKDAPKKPPMPPRGDDDSAEAEESEPAEPERITEHKSFRGNETCDKVADRFAPMKALREFEEVTEEKLAEMELVETEATLEVTSDKGGKTFDIGGRAYGSNDYYLREREAGTVYLVESRMIGDIKGGHNRLMERSLQAFKVEEIDRAVLQAETGAREFQQMNRDDRKAAFWADPADTTRAADAADAWIAKVIRLRATDYLEGDPEGLQTAVRVGFTDAGRDMGWIEVGTALGDDGETIYVARSGHSVAWVTVSEHTAADVVEGLAEVIES